MLKMKNEDEQGNDLTVQNADGEWVVVPHGETVEISDEDVARGAPGGFTASKQAIGAAVKRAERAREEAEAEKAKEQEAPAEDADAAADTSAEGEQA